MLVVSSGNRSGASFADYLLDFTKRSLLTIQIQRNVERIRLWTVGHRTPALESGRAWTLIHLDTDLRDLSRKVCHFAGLCVDLKDSLVPQIRCMDELSGRPIKLTQNTELCHHEK